MLQAIRSRAASVVVKALFVLLIASFAVWGIGDIFRGQPQQTVLATVGDQKIRAAELQAELQPELEQLSARLGRDIDLHQAKRLGIVDALFNRLIERSLIDQEAARLGLAVSDQVIRSAIIDNPAFKTKDGQFNRLLFNEVLARNRLSEAQYVARLRSEIPRSDLLRAVTAGASAPRSLVDVIYRYRKEKRIADIVALPVAKAGDVGEPSDAQLDKYYKAHQDEFRAPEFRGFTVAGLAPADLAKTIEIPEKRLKEAYKEREDEFAVPERRAVEQILAPTEAKAKAAEKALAAGQGWKEVATTIAGQDPSTIDLGLVKRRDLPPALAGSAFALPLDKPSKPIKSPLGWHILRVVKINKASVVSYDKAKPKLEKQLAAEAAANRLEKIGDHVDDALAGGATLEEAAKKFDLRTVTVPAADTEGNDPHGKAVALPLAPKEVLKTAFSTEKGRTSRVIHTEGGGIFVVRTDKVVPPHVRPLAEVKKKAVAGWQAEKRRQKVADEAKQLAASVKSGERLAAAAAKTGLKATTSPPLLRRPQADSDVPPALVARLFAAKPGEVVTVETTTGAFVAQLDKIEAAAAPKPADTADLARQITDRIQADVAKEYTAALRRRFPVEIDHQTLNQLF